MPWLHALMYVVTHSYFEVDALCEGNRVSGEAIMLEDFMLLQCQVYLPCLLTCEIHL